MPEVSRTTQHTTTFFFIASILKLTHCLLVIREGNVANLRGFCIWILVVSITFTYSLFQNSAWLLHCNLSATPNQLLKIDNSRNADFHIPISTYRCAEIAHDLMTGHSRIRSHYVRPRHLSSPDT